MAFIHIVPEDDATGSLRAFYDADIRSDGYVPNTTKAMSLRPDVIEAWRGLSKAIRSHMRLRRYELVTLAAASALRCTY